MDWWLLVFLPCVLPVLSNWCEEISKCLCGNVFSCLSGKVDNMWKLKENLALLRSAFEVLIAERDVVLRRVTAEEIKGRQRLPGVDKWLLEVQATETETKQLIDDASGQDASASEQRRSTSGCWSTDNISICCLGEEVFKKLTEVKSLSGQGFKDVTGKAPPPVVEMKPVKQTYGLKTKIDKTWESLMEDGNRKLGIYGMGGVGKTTLLASINNKFDEVKDNFDVVIWFKVSKDADVEKIRDDNDKIQVDIKKIQDTIGERLHLCDENWSTYSKKRKADDIRSVLTETKPRFVLLLDDLWEQVRLEDIGIPLQGREYKIVFTTRLKDVCTSMGANEDIEIECLGEYDAWELFKTAARCRNFNDQLTYIAKEIAAKCCGLPLALEVIGKTMASKTTVGQWRRALETLKSYPSEWKGTKEGIFQVLKLSYDQLEVVQEEEAAKLCFQYCALFPKAYDIKRDALIEYWIGEGIIDEKYERRRAKCIGNGIIETLVESSLLLKDGESEQRVYMHSMIREMALWIVSGSEDGERFVVKADAGLSQLPDVPDWNTVTKMSLMNNQITGIPNDPEFPDQARLVTLFLQNNKLVDIVGSFFLFMSNLVVLDLSRNPGLTELPDDISKLVALRYLSLLGTKIKVLPESFGELSKLIHLDLESTPNLGNIILVSGLLKLQVLRFYSSAAALDFSLLYVLERLKGLELLTITVRESGVFEAFLKSKLAGKTQGLSLQGVEVSGASLAAIGELASLHNLEMVNCDMTNSGTEWGGNRSDQYSPSTSSNQISPWFKNLSVVGLSSCEGLRDVTWLMYAENLESLSITLSPKLEELIIEKKAVDANMKPFRQLQVLDLNDLGELKSIYESPLSFPELRRVNIKKCPKLHKLPLNSTSVVEIDNLIIEVEEGWLDGFEWESEAAQERFGPVIRTAAAV